MDGCVANNDCFPAHLQRWWPWHARSSLDGAVSGTTGELLWTVAFAVFALAAGAEVAGTAFGWSGSAGPHLLPGRSRAGRWDSGTGRVYLLFPERVPAFVPGLAILTGAVARRPSGTPQSTKTATNRRMERPCSRSLPGCFDVAINAGGTLVLVAGTLYSAWRIYASGGSRQRAWAVRSSRPVRSSWPWEAR